MDRRLLFFAVFFCAADAGVFTADAEADARRAQSGARDAQSIPSLSGSLRSLSGVGPILGQLVHAPDAALQAARAIERGVRRKRNAIPQITLARFKALTAEPAQVANKLESGELPHHFRLLYPHRSDPRTKKAIVREVDIHLPANATEQLRQHGGLWSITNLHGYTSDAIEQEAISNMNALASDEGLLAIHPQGLKSYDKQLHMDVRSWNTPTCCGPAQEHRFRDIEFLKALHGTLDDAFKLERSALTGESNGGFMSYYARRKLGPMFDVVLPVVGTEGKPVDLPRAPKQLVPTHVYLGSRDILVNRLSAFVLDAAHPVKAAENVMRENGAVRVTTKERPGVYSETLHHDVDGRLVGSIREIFAAGFASHLWPGFEYTTKSILKKVVDEFQRDTH